MKEDESTLCLEPMGRNESSTTSKRFCHELWFNMKALTKKFGPPKWALQIICKDPKEVAQRTTLAPPRANIAPGDKRKCTWHTNVTLLSVSTRQ